MNITAAILHAQLASCFDFVVMSGDGGGDENLCMCCHQILVDPAVPDDALHSMACGHTFHKDLLIHVQSLLARTFASPVFVPYTLPPPPLTPPPHPNP